MSTYREFLYDIKESFKETRDDSEITLSRILYISLLAINRLRYDRINKFGNDKYLAIFDVSNSIELDGNVKKFTLPEEIYDMQNDMGLKFVLGQIEDDSLHLPIKFQRITPTKLPHLYLSVSTLPSPDNAYFYLVGNEVRLLGVDCVDFELFVGTYSPINVSSDCKVNGEAFSLDREIDLSSELVEQARYRVLNSLTFGVQIQADDINDGSQRAALIRQAVNEPQENQTEQ